MYQHGIIKSAWYHRHGIIKSSSRIIIIIIIIHSSSGTCMLHPVLQGLYVKHQLTTSVRPSVSTQCSLGMLSQFQLSEVHMHMPVGSACGVNTTSAQAGTHTHGIITLPCSMSHDMEDLNSENPHTRSGQQVHGQQHESQLE
jgi:hypothetical protein